MGRASISIAITSNFNAKGIDSAIAKMEKLSVAATSMKGQYGKTLVDAGGQLGLASTRLMQLGKSIASIGDKLTMGVTLPMGIAAGAAVAAAVQIDTAWYNVRKTVDMTEDGYERLKQGAIDLANTQPVTADTILNIEMLGGQLGIANENLESFAKTVSGLEIASGGALDYETAAMNLAKYANITQMAQDDIDNFASAIVHLGNTTATTEADMLNLATKFASAGHIAGMTDAEILGISATLSALGMKAEAGGSSLSQIITKISTEVDTNGEHVAQWAQLAGKSVDDFAKAWKDDAAGTFEDILKGISSSGDEMNAVLDELGVTQIRQSDAMRRLASSGDLMHDTIEQANQAFEQNIALQQEVEKRNASLESKFQTIGNRIVNTAAEFGDPIADMVLKALDSLAPLGNGIKSVADAFSSASPDAQQFAFNLGLVAAAAGPVMSVSGRLIQAAGKVGQGIGRAMQQYGVYTEALKTNDVALMRNYAEQDTLATRLGLTRNAAVKAAGGLDKFKLETRAATEIVQANAENAKRAEIYQSEYAKAVQAGAKSHTEASAAAKKALETRKNSNAITDAGVKATRNLSVEEAHLIAQTEQGQAKIASYGKATEQASTGVTKLKGVLMGLGGMLAIGAAVAGVTYLVTELQRATEKAEQFKLATKGLNDAVRSAGDSMGEQGSAKTIGEYSQRIEQLRVKQGELANTIVETNSNASAQVSELTRAWQTIDRYANQSGIGAAEHYQLERAIEAVNEACGTQYAVMDDGTNRIQDETGAILDNTDAIKDAIEARKQLIEVQAIESNLQGLYSQREDTLREMGDLYKEHGEDIRRDIELQQRNAEIIKQMNSLTDSHGRIIQGNESKYAELNDELARNNSKMSEFNQVYGEAKQQLDAVNDAIEYEEGRLEDATGAAEGLGNSIRSWLTSSGWEAFNEGFGSSARDLTAFSKACEDAGINVDQLAKLSDTTVRNMITGFTGTRESIENALQSTRDGRQLLQELGLAVDEFVAKFEGSEKFTKPFDDIGADLQDFADKCREAGINFESLNGLGSDQIRQLARNFDGSVQSIIEALGQIGPAGQQMLSDLADNWASSFTPATQAIIDSIVRTGDYTRVELMSLAMEFGQEGENATRAFVEGIEAGLAPMQAANLADRLNELFKGSLDAEQAREAADAYMEALKNGLTDADALQAAIDAIKQQLMGLDLSEEGRNASSTFFADFNEGIQQNALDSSVVYDDTGRAIGKMLADGTVVGLDENSGRVYDSGARVPEKYGQGATDNAGAVTGSGNVLLDALMGILTGGVGRASGVGSDTGAGYGDAVAAQGHVAETAAINTLGKLLIVWLLGIASAKQAGTKTGTGFAESLATSSQKAVTAARAISIATGTAFGAGAATAAAAGNRLGAAFAQAVAASGAAAVANAQSVRSRVASIFSNIPTANVRVNVTRTVTTTGSSSSFGGHPVQYAALPSQIPIAPVPLAGLERATVQAEGAVQRIAQNPGPYSWSGSAPSTQAVTTVNSRTTQAVDIDYGRMERVMESAMAKALARMPQPVAQIDGYRLMDYVDSELGRMDRMW